MNHNIKNIFVVKAGTTLRVSGATSALVEGQIGVFNPSFTAISDGAVPTPANSPYIMIAQGSGNAELGSFKTSRIYLNRVKAWRGVAFNTASQEMEVELTPGSFKCGRTYFVTVRVFEHFVHSVHCPALEETFVVKTPCCDECEGDCEDLVATSYLTEFITKINESKLGTYVTASVDTGKIVLIGKVVPGLTAPTCSPSTIPVISNKVRFKIFGGEGFASQVSEEVESECDSWSSEVTQDIIYPIGSGAFISEMEDHYAGYNQPWASHKRYNIPYYNDGQFIKFANTALNYDVYELEYLDPSAEGFEHKTAIPMSVVVAFPSSLSAEADKFETILNTWLANSPAYMTAVNI